MRLPLARVQVVLLGRKREKGGPTMKCDAPLPPPLHSTPLHYTLPGYVRAANMVPTLLTPADQARRHSRISHRSLLEHQFCFSQLGFAFCANVRTA
jgi:hypothetical protein